MYDLHYIARSVLHRIGEEHHIIGHDQEASISRGPSIRPPVSSTPVRMQPIRGRRRGRIDQRGRGRDGGRSRGRDGEGGHGTPKPTLPPLLPTPIFAPNTFIPPILTHHPILLYPHKLTHLYHIRCRQSQLPW